MSATIAHNPRMLWTVHPSKTEMEHLGKFVEAVRMACKPTTCRIWIDLVGGRVRVNEEWVTRPKVTVEFVLAKSIDPTKATDAFAMRLGIFSRQLGAEAPEARLDEEARNMLARWGFPADGPLF